MSNVGGNESRSSEYRVSTVAFAGSTPVSAAMVLLICEKVRMPMSGSGMSGVGIGGFAKKVVQFLSESVIFKTSNEIAIYHVKTLKKNCF